MTVDVERELKIAMEEFTSDVLAPPDLLSRLPRRRRRQFPRIAVMTAAVAAALVVAGVVVVGEQTGGEGGPPVTPLSTYKMTKTLAAHEQQAKTEMARVIQQWGPTRGDRAGDEQLMTRLRAEWAHPSQHPTNLGSFEPVQSPTGPVKILWAGTTPEGPAAYAVQPTKDPVSDYWYGIFLPGSDGQPQLAQRGQLTAGFDIGEFDSHVMSFTTGPAHKSVVVIPTDASDSVRISFSTSTDAQGRYVPQWQDVAMHDGAAIAPVASGGNVYGTVVEVSHGGTVVADHMLDFISTHLLNEGPPKPSNALPMWCNGCAIGTYGPGYGKAMLTAWLVRHGPAYLPVWVGDWSVGGSLRSGVSVFATQLWAIGHPARTVVLIDDQNAGQVDVLYDAETKPADRPLVAVRLPQGAGWLVGAGPDAVVTGWRTSADAPWHAVASKKALLVHTDAPSIQLRLVVNGEERVVTP